MKKLMEYLGISQEKYYISIAPIVDNSSDKSVVEIHEALDENIDIGLRELQLLAAYGIKYLNEVKNGK